jgi:hypothetical protein
VDLYKIKPVRLQEFWDANHPVSDVTWGTTKMRLAVRISSLFLWLPDFSALPQEHENH